ncbi:MAG: HAD hydrolase-like protein [Legionellaceae bacterium]|nr:HAD hydrolase-like protein [Legionellaceae bacterium]MBP9775464.1 HAD hydrolase-like protein [Legionellaceae bacterium]
MSANVPRHHKYHVIFDFDGTLIDSFACAVRVFNALAETHHFRQILPEEITTLKQMDSKAWMRYFQVPLYKLPVIMYQAAQYIQHDLLSLQPFPGIAEMLQHLHAAGCQLNVVSSNSKKNVKTWLAHHDLAPLFHRVAHAPHFYGKAKTLKQLIKQEHYTPINTCYIGDETRDIEAAQKSGIDSIAVTWGFHAETLLIQHRPNILARSPQDIVAAILNP